MKAIKLPPQSDKQLQALAELYRTTQDVRLRQRAQMILLAAEKQMVACEIAEMVRQDEHSVRRWLKGYRAEGIEGCPTSRWAEDGNR
jgi:predicted transcriptional regulator